MRSCYRIAVVLIGACAIALAAKTFIMPASQPAQNYPAHDAHPKEFVTVGLDPYDQPQKSGIFTVKYADVGYLPVFMVITNDGDQPVSLVDMKAQLVTEDRSKLSPASEDDLYRRLSHPSRRSSPYPLPFPTGGVKGAVKKDAQDEISNSRFRARAVEPHSSQSGFLFFDVADLSNPLPGARFYLTGVRDSGGNELMYFEIPLDKYLKPKP